MTETFNGSCFSLFFDSNEVPNKTYEYTLPAGYSLRTIRISSAINISYISPWTSCSPGDIITFPVVNSRSPSKLLIYIPDPTTDARIYIDIFAFGQIPDPNYFDNAFEPILVTGDDGKEYNVIPSDQFK